jgi:pepF/M3 family oligoendopeptidase
MTVVYPSLESAEFEQGFQHAITGIRDLAAFFDQQQIGQQAPRPLDDATIQVFEQVIGRLNALLDEVGTLTAYIVAFVSTDSRDVLAQARFSELQQHFVQLSMLGTRFTAWVGSLDVEALISRSVLAHDHAHALRRAKIEAAHQMSPSEEQLAAELGPSGGGAWGNLHDTITSQLSVEVGLPTGRQELPMSMVRNLAYDPDREVRRRAYEAELVGWERVAIPLAAALNSIKGEVNTLVRKRGWESVLDAALFDASIDRPTLDAMLTAAREAFPDFRRYLRAKARAIGLDQLTWYDLFAPVNASGANWSFEAAASFVAEQFGAFSPRMSEFGARAFRERWVDAEPRPGKRDGAFCMPLRRDESRVLANFSPNYKSMSTLAHELGHGYHNLNLAERTALQRSTPVTLAETASIFCETIVQHAALQRADQQGQMEILEAALENACQVVIDITSRFLFESAVFERRQRRELSIQELNDLMLDAQRQTYGDGLEANVLHPYMWAVKGHYYSAGLSYYNFPYMFGLLFGLGLYARFQSDPEGFRRGYDDLLSSTGLADAAALAARFGIDIRTPDFWRASLDIVRGDVARFEQLVDGRA